MDGPVLSVPKRNCTSKARERAKSLHSTYHTIEISRCAIAHPRSGAEPVIGPRFARTRWRHSEMINALAFELFVGDDLDAET